MKFDYYEKDTLFCNVAYSQFDSNLREAIAARRICGSSFLGYCDYRGK